MTGAGRCRIFSRGGEIIPRYERNERRKIDARIAEPRDESFEARAAVDEWKLAQVFFAVGEKIVGAQMRGKLRRQLAGDGFAVEPLLQHVE